MAVRVPAEAAARATQLDEVAVAEVDTTLPVKNAAILPYPT